MTRSGATLLELAVALAVVGIAAGVAGVAFRAPAPPSPAAMRAARLAEARRAALELRHPVAFTVAVGERVVEGTAFPDGRVMVDDSAVAMDVLAGRPRAPR
ncbi:MAG TPA: prepilin-type N-terminal cleavage/methylation domain-containing protein [Longimicrobium sp.]|nr:prepilin-type N-terminal cleavage/methylation domain-containing protein [Longimicrobium sp.]